ncbi:hypothetical protein B0H13DRAFT_2398764 [Mycena leptocephala]|nr:hypothetical protein B0H13DRAFT_2398764 [Mycena leptocephala]
MAQSSVSARAYIKGYAIFVVFLAILLFTPALIDLYYPRQPPSEPPLYGPETDLRVALQPLHSSAQSTISLPCSTIRISGSVVCAAPAPLLGPRARGRHGPAVGARRHRRTDAATEAPKRSVIRSVIGRIVSLASCSYYFIQQWYLDDIVSLNRSLLENLGSVLLYILRGFEVLFALFLIKVFVVWMEKGSSDVAAAEGVTAAPAPAAPLQILLDNGVPTKEEKEFIQVEKA